MTLMDRRLWEIGSTEDTTSSGSSAFRMAPVGGGVSPRNRLRRFEEQRVFLTWLSAWGPMLGTREEQASILHQFEEVSTDATSWEILDGAMEGLQGVVAVPRQRTELFRMTIDISAGSLPRRKQRFAFLDQSGPHDDE